MNYVLSGRDQVMIYGNFKWVLEEFSFTSWSTSTLMSDV
jgi:hypothetical protein